MNWTNRLSADTGDELIRHASKVKVELHRYDGRLYANYEVHGSLGDFDLDEEADADTIEKPDFGLLRNLLDRFERKGDQP